MTPAEQAERYVAKCRPAISGQGGHNQTFSVACELVNGFGLGEEDAFAILATWNAGNVPPWTESELRHKIRDAAKASHSKPRGHKLKQRQRGESRPLPQINPAAAPVKQIAQIPAAKYSLSRDDWPEPIAGGAAALLAHCFEQGEGVRIVNATLNEEGREIPDGAGVVLSRAEWIARFEKSGGPNGVFSSSRRTGIYVSINPMKPGGGKDEDVTAFRHALVEFDETLSPEEQFSLYKVSRLPCAAVIFSGGKSVHAWVKVDAKDRAQYAERVEILRAHLEAGGFRFDAKNKNPSRFSRLPDCVRFDSRQELLALGMGAESFTAWLKEKEHDALGPCDDFIELLSVDTDNDPSCVIGFRDEFTVEGDRRRKALRYLCKGKAAWIIGPSGVGKSSLNTEFAIGFALNRPVFGIQPARSLRSLIVQGENDRCDLAEICKGIARGHDMDDGGEHEFDREMLRDKVRFKTETTSIGREFVDRLHRLIDREKPDIVWCDPLLSFAGVDVTKQEQVSMFLRQWLQPVLEATGVVMFGIHHTGKPKSAKETANWSVLDYAYSGLGSSELVNWARAVMVLHPHGEGNFELKLAKRGKRAGAMHPGGAWAEDAVWIRHARGSIRWEQIDPPVEPEEPAKEKKGSGAEKLAASNLHEILAALPATGETARSLGAVLAKFSRKSGNTVGETTCRTRVLDLLVGSGKLAVNEEGLYVRGANA